MTKVSNLEVESDWVEEDVLGLEVSVAHAFDVDGLKTTNQLREVVHGKRLFESPRHADIVVENELLTKLKRDEQPSLPALLRLKQAISPLVGFENVGVINCQHRSCLLESCLGNRLVNSQQLLHGYLLAVGLVNRYEGLAI